MSIQAPQFLVDVFRDLRDRRLLIPAAALLVGLVAVPMLLGRSSEPAPPPAPSGEVALEGLATEPAVLAENPTVRDYKRRLDQLDQKNPFEEHFSVPAGAAGEGLEDETSGVQVGDTGGTPSTGATGSDLPTGTTDTSGSISAGSSSSGLSASPSPSTSVPASSGSSDGSSGGSGSGGGGGNSSEPKPPVTRFYTYRIDVLVGPAGDATPRDDVGQLRILPSPNRPVVAYLGANDGGNKAYFSVSDDVTSTDGDGRCLPGNSNCTYLVMEEGDDRTFDYAPNLTTYRLKLKRINAVELKDAGVPAQ